MNWKINLMICYLNLNIFNLVPGVHNRDQRVHIGGVDHIDDRPHRIRAWISPCEPYGSRGYYVICTGPRFADMEEPFSAPCGWKNVILVMCIIWITMFFPRLIYRSYCLT